MSVEQKRREVLLTEAEIKERVVQLGREIAEQYRDKNLLIVSLLKGSFIFTADLVRHIDLNVRIEFMITSSYGHGHSSSGNLEIIQDIDEDISDYDVLIVDDIADSGITLKSVMAHLRAKRVRSLRSCVFLDKPSRRQVEVVPDFIGYQIPDKFIVGYGLNYGYYFRNVPHIFAFED